MWNRLKAAAAVASNAVQALDDMLNDKVDPVEEFEHYWKSVQLEHNEIVQMQALEHAQNNSETSDRHVAVVGSTDATTPTSPTPPTTTTASRRASVDDVSVLRNASIKENLEQLVTILRDEEAADRGQPSSPRTSNGAVHPCLSYMLEHHVVEILCAMASQSNPGGLAVCHNARGTTIVESPRRSAPHP